MRRDQIESWTFNRREAAEIVEVTEAQIANWMNRYDLFPEKRQGTGRHAYFRLSDLMVLGAMKVLINGGLTPENAADALRPYQGPYGSLLHNGRQASIYPGTFFLTQNHEGRWVGADSPKSLMRIEVRAWPLFDLIWPRFEKAILENPGKIDNAELRDGLASFKARIEEIRQDRWGN